MPALRRVAACAAAILLFGSIAIAQTTPPERDDGNPPIEVRGWSKKPRWKGPGPMPRHHVVAIWGIPRPYNEMTNPLPRDHETLARGLALYREHCAGCHGARGAGDGEQGRDLRPAPGNLVWLSDVPEKQWDPYMYWTTAEGGLALGTAMPAYKNKLSSDDIWAVTAYIQANLPFVSQWRFK